MNVKFGNKKISEGEEVSFDRSRNLSVTWRSKDYDTLLIYNDTSSRLHALIINIANGDISTGKVIKRYTVPRTKKRNQYTAYVLRQRGILKRECKGKDYDIECIFSITDPKYKMYFYIGPKDKESTAHLWIKEDMIDEITPQQEKYCRCILKVASKQTPECLESRNWGDDCKNPYAICAYSTRTSAKCGKFYDIYSLPQEQLLAYARLYRVPIPKPYTRDKLVDNIRRWKKQEGYKI